MSLEKSTKATSSNVMHKGELLYNIIDSIKPVSRADAKLLTLKNGDFLRIDGYLFKYRDNRQLIDGQPLSEITFDDELHILVNSGGMLEFDDYKSLPSLETENYANYQAKLQGRSDAVSIGCIGDSTTYCQALPNTVGATNKIGQQTNFGDGSVYEHWQYNESWPKVIGDVLSRAVVSGAQVNNLGYSGDRALSGYLRHRVRTGDDVSLIMYGINDVLFATSNGANPGNIYDGEPYSLANYQLIMRKTIARELIRGKAVIVLGTTIFGSLSGWDGSRYSSNRLTESYDAVAKSVASEFGCLFVDTKSEILKAYKLSSILQEGTHLSDVGCKVMAGKLSAVLLSSWKTPNYVTSNTTLLSNPSVTNMISKGTCTVLPNQPSNSPAFDTNDPSTIMLSQGVSVFYPVYVMEDGIMVIPEMLGNSSGCNITFSVNNGAPSPQRLNPRESGTEPASSKLFTLSGKHIDEGTINFSQDIFHLSIPVKGWHLLEVVKVGGPGGALLDLFQFYNEKEIRTKHVSGLNAWCNMSNKKNIRLGNADMGNGLFEFSFSSDMDNIDYAVLVDTSTHNVANFYRVYDKTLSGFKVQFMSASGAGLGLNFVLASPYDFNVTVYGGR